MAATAAGLLSACGSEPNESVAPAVQTLPHLKWRLASSFPPALDTIYGAAHVFSSVLQASTEGRFRVLPYAAGGIVPGLQVLDAVQSGTVEMGHTASYYFIGKNPALAFDTGVPFGLNSREQNAWMYHGGGFEQLRPIFSDFNIINFPGGNTGVQMGGWFRHEIESVSDLRGIRMRIPGLGGRVMDRLGVTVQVLPGGEIYHALDRGVIDAAEWTGPYDDEKLGFDKVAPYYYYPGWWEPGTMLSFYVNLDAWNKLPVSYRDALHFAAFVANHDMMTKYDAKNPPALSRLIQGGTQLRQFSDDIMTEARRVSFELMEEAAHDKTYDRVYRSWKEVYTEYNSWFGTAERSYTTFTFAGPEATQNAGPTASS